MSNQEFENYVALIGKLLQLTREQRDQISGELQDHLQLRVEDLVSDGVSNQDAICQALEEFGDAAVMAKNFQSVINLKRRRWMMRFATFSIAGVFLAAILTMAMWPDNARFGTPNLSLAQTSAGEQAQTQSPAEAEADVSGATKRNLIAEEALKKIVSLAYDESPFSEIQKELEELTGLNFLHHSSAMDDSLSPDEPFTFRMKDMPLNKTLELMLEIKNATYVLDEGVVVIISLDDAEDVKWFRLKMFDCRELVARLPESVPMHTSGGGGGGGGGGFGGGGMGGGGGHFFVPHLPATQVASTEPSKTINTEKISAELKQLQTQMAELKKMLRPRAEPRKPVVSREATLVNLVQSMVEPDSWEQSGQGLGQVAVVNGVLIVKQTEAVLAQVENLIKDLEGNVLGKVTKIGKIQVSDLQPLTARVDPALGDLFRSGSNEANPFGSGSNNP